MTTCLSEVENEKARLQELVSLEILDTEAEEEYNNIVELVAMVTDCPVALISLSDRDRQWFKAKVGIDVTEVPRDNSFCDTAIRQGETFVIHDTLLDERFCNNALVVNPPHVRFYAAQPLTTSNGFRIGTLCAIDVQPRTLNALQLRHLELLARQTTRLMELRLANRRMKIMQAALECSIADEQRANEAKSQFLASMSHEIRTPLGAILGFAELLRDEGGTAAERELFIETIIRNGQSLTRIIDDILDLSKIESGQLSIEQQAFSLRELLNETKDLFTGRLRGKNLTLSLSIAPGVPNIVISDPYRLRQILVNLIGNSIKFTEAGMIEVVVERPMHAAGASGAHDSSEQVELKIRISDTGIGISEAHFEKLFKPFSQAETSTCRRYGGTGLGLVLSKRLAQSLGGDVTLVRSEPGKGSEFALQFAAREVSVLQAKRDGESDGPGHSDRDLSEAEILVVDDSSDNLVLVKHLLEKSQAKVEVAASGTEALHRAREKRFDLILLDIEMPSMDGYSTLAQLRAQGFENPVVACTAHAMKEERLRIQKAGFDGYFTKPIDAGRLATSLSSYL